MKDDISSIKDDIGFIVTGLGILLIVLCFVILGFQVYFWLMNGVWIELPLNYIFNVTDNWSDTGSWKGLKSIAKWLLDEVPITFTLLIVGFLMADG